MAAGGLRGLPLSPWGPGVLRSSPWRSLDLGVAAGVGVLKVKRQLLLSVELFLKHYQLRLLATNFPLKSESNRLLRCSKRRISWSWACLACHLLHRFINIAIIRHL